LQGTNRSPPSKALFGEVSQDYFLGYSLAIEIALHQNKP